ncbi:hypothetical protein KSP39_PZI012561 [Platanthera zijinensis]|uniref:CCHC-type domain-containing protein n=1 Tax=Platanthera zijinensis TaxID=2320716 RepID=A0AAP0BF37_9ASPA
MRPCRVDGVDTCAPNVGLALVLNSAKTAKGLDTMLENARTWQSATTVDFQANWAPNSHNFSELGAQFAQFPRIGRPIRSISANWAPNSLNFRELGAQFGQVPFSPIFAPHVPQARVCTLRLGSRGSLRLGAPCAFDNLEGLRHLHIAAECSTKALCWNCKEPGHLASECTNEGICHTCGKSGHIARDCPTPGLPPGDMRLCNNCYKQGHMAADCTNEKACNNCRKTGHLARDCSNEPVCNLCNISGHVARQCPKADAIGDRGGSFYRGGVGGGGGGGGGYRDVICRNCNQIGHISRECMGPLMVCNNCGGRGHFAYECPSGRFFDRAPPRRY